MQGRELEKAEKNSTEPEWMSEQQKPTLSVLLTPNSYRAQCWARVQNDELGKLIEQHAQLLVDNGWEKFVHLLRQQGDLHLDLARAGHHPAYQLLDNIAKRGVLAVMLTEPWTEEKNQQCLKRGPHKSCNEFLDFLHEEILQFAHQGY